MSSFWNRLSYLFKPKAGTPSADDDYWYSPVYSPTSGGVNVTPDTAMQVSAVMACVRIISETLATLPLHMYRRLPNGGKDKAVRHPLYDILFRQPNQWQTSVEFLEMMQGHLCLRGNACAEKVPGRRGSVDQLVPIHPDRVQIERLENGKLRYIIQDQWGQNRKLSQDQIFHVRGMSSDGIKGLSPINYAAESIGVSFATQQFAARFFSNNARPSGVLEHPGVLKDPKALGRLKTSWQESQTGSKQHSIAILEDGIKFHEIGIKPEEAQFLETRKYQALDIARIYRIPPHMIAEMDRATFSNIEHQGLEFVVHTMRPWLVRWEKAILRDLIDVPDIYFAEFLVDALLRGDIKSRYEAYASGINAGWISRNEVREKENLNPRPGLDEMLVPLNMQSSSVRAEDIPTSDEIYKELEQCGIAT